MDKDIQDLLIEAIKNALRDLSLDKTPLDVLLDLPQDPRFGDLSTNIALRLSSLTQRPSPEIAADIVNSIKKYSESSSLKDYLKEIRVEGGGFINFYLSLSFFYRQARAIITKGKTFFSQNLGRKKRVLVEFVSANPTGPLSIAHARQAAVGDALGKILDFSGFKVKREYYLNDEGNQINILGKSVELRLKELSGEAVDFPADYYQGEYIRDIAIKIKNQKSKIKNFSEYGVKEILKNIKKDLSDFGVRFDYWYSQKDLRKSGKIKKALDFLQERGFLYEQDGAVWFKSSELGDDKDRVVVKSDGTFTYLTPDIAYHQDKFQRGFTWLINLWGPDHHGYINRLKAAVKALGKDPQLLSIIIVQLASLFREGKPIQMSTRKGQYITLREVLDEVGLDAARFFLLMRRTSSHLDFDLEVAKKETPENPVYYIQYAHARICSILNNRPARINLKALDLTLLKEGEEIELLKKFSRFSYILNICLKTQDPYMLTVYLQELAQSFHKFYDRHRVLGQEPHLVKARLTLIEATRIIIACGLELLGVSRPKKM
ncbi:MAG: arginine--tRNA ligase [Omnitrophica WOR_2 bacterium RIFCSPLOWO2_01_FULL_41_12]|nr:MAG: arginine--tRNA ligase [Omnitrophica WOR_2 bacterium RIFCSPLOWO2_01_FULL_41_12]